MPKGEHEIDLAQWKRRAEKWAEFRKRSVTLLVRDVYRRAKTVKPNAQVTAAVFSSLESAEAVYQDWPRWLREGTIDYVIPMAYTEDPAELARQIDQWKTVDPQLSRIIPGLSIYQRRDGKAVPRDPDLVQIQRRLCQQRATHGNVYFSLHHLSDDLIDVFREEFYRTKAPPYAPPRRSP